jgi:hypothetical protein
VQQGILSTVASVRGALARAAGLRWARIGRLDLAVFGAGALTIWNAVPQFAEDFWGVPFLAAWIGGTAGVAALILVARRLVRPSGSAPGGPRALGGLRAFESVLLIGIVVSWILYDFHFWQQTCHLYDLNVYLGSASRWMAGGHPYVSAPLTEWPFTARNDYFLYPPPLLPFFAVLSKLPEAPVALGWTALMVGCAYKAFRMLGIDRRWSLVLLTFPPVVIGFESGNVASLTFLLFTAGYRTGASLIAGGIFKVQTGFPALWLIRERRGRAIIVGAGVMLLIVIGTLPLVGLDSWRAWWEGLGYRATSQSAVPALYGYSYAKVVPATVYALAALAFVGAALLFRGRRGLAALGLAVIFGSPALWPHGFAFALPAVLMLESGTAVWLVLGAGAFGPNMWLLFAAGWLAVAAVGRRPSGALHPLLGTDGVWPDRRRPRLVRRLAPMSALAPPIPDAASSPGTPNDILD